MRRGFRHVPRTREEIERAYAEALTARAENALLLEVFLDLRDLITECAWRLSDLAAGDTGR